MKVPEPPSETRVEAGPPAPLTNPAEAPVPSTSTLLWHAESAGCIGFVAASVIACVVAVEGCEARGEAVGLGVFLGLDNAVTAWLIVFPLSSIATFVAKRVFRRKANTT